MKQLSTGTGLMALGVCVLIATVVATHRSGGEAFAQGTGGERRIVSAFVQITDDYDTNLGNIKAHYAYRIWSDNTIDVRLIGSTYRYTGRPYERVRWLTPNDTWGDDANLWTTRDNGTSGFRPLTEVDMSGETDAGDISQVLMDFNTRSDDLPPPPIDCNINAPR